MLVLLAVELFGDLADRERRDGDDGQAAGEGAGPHQVRRRHLREDRSSAVDMENALLALDKATKLDPEELRGAVEGGARDRVARRRVLRRQDQAAALPGRGIDYAKAAIELDGKRVEGHYYSGNNLGLSASAKLVGAKFMVPSVRDAWKKAMTIDACFDYGGPPRNLGELYAKAPPWPASIGHPDKGVELVGQALKCAADWPQNNLFLGDALCAAEKYDDAKKQYQTVVDGRRSPRTSTFCRSGRTSRRRAATSARRRSRGAQRQC